LNNFNNYIDLDKINSQLDRAEIQKRILTRKIYREYELYLDFVRDLLFISVEKGLNQIYSYPTINDNFLNKNQFSVLFEKKITELIYKNLPLLTVEQLKTQLSQFGITPDQMFEQMNKTLIRMKDELDKTS